MKQFLVIPVFIILQVSVVFSQETVYGPGYRTVLMNNPAFSGAGGEGNLKLSYLNFYPGNRYNLHSIYASYDSYFEGLHGGIGIWVSDDYLGGIINDTRGGFSYAYSLQAGQELFINAGLTAAVFHRGLSFGNAVLPDMIDPLGGAVLPSGETLVPSSRTVFDVGAGFLFMYRNFFAGLSLDHLSQPDLSTGAQTERLRRKLFFNSALDISFGGSRSLSMNPAIFMEIQDDYVAGGIGSSIESKILAVSMLLMGNNVKNKDIQASFSIKTGKIGLFYTYRFNIYSPNSMMPLSLLHQTGLTLGLNTVNKRKVAKTISLPEL